MPWTERLKNGLYRAVWRDEQNQQRSRSGFTQDAAAKRYAGEQETRARSGQASYQGRSMTWGQWQPLWLALRRVERTTSASDATRLARWVEPHWGKVPLARITTEAVQLWVNELDNEMAPASVEKVYHLLSSSLRAAVKAKRLAVSPCVDIYLPEIPPADERWLTRGEVDLALFYMVEPYRTAALILVGTGMRFGEMAGLHRHRVNWDSQTIDVFEVWDGQEIKAYPKGRRKRRIPMASWVGEAIMALPNDDARSCGHPHPRGSRCRSGLVVTGPRGAALDARNMLRRHWTQALERAGLDHARQHDLRHTTASWLVQSGRSLTEVAQILGQSDTSVTARYAHLAGAHMDAVRTVLDGMPPGPVAPNLPLDLEEEAG